MSENNPRYTLYRCIDSETKKERLTREIIAKQLRSNAVHGIGVNLVCSAMVAALFGIYNIAIPITRIADGVNSDGMLLPTVMLAVVYALLAAMVVSPLAVIVYKLVKLMMICRKPFCIYEDTVVGRYPETGACRYLLKAILALPVDTELKFEQFGKWQVPSQSNRRGEVLSPYSESELFYDGKLSDFLRSCKEGDRFYIVSFDGVKTACAYRADMFTLDDDLKSELEKGAKNERE